MTKYIVIKVCCFDCKRFEKLNICEEKDILELIEKKLKEEIEDFFYIYSIEGDLIFKI